MYCVQFDFFDSEWWEELITDNIQETKHTNALLPKSQLQYMTIFIHWSCQKPNTIWLFMKVHMPIIGHVIV
jgi:hypothetical protein